MSEDVATSASTSASSVTVIKPQLETDGRVVKLSAIDQIAPRDYISVCLFFKLDSGADKRHIFRIFEMALLKTVRDIPELACCVQQHADNLREEVELLFDINRGAEIHYRDYTSPELSHMWNFGTFEQLEQDHFPLNKMPRCTILGTSAKLASNVRLPALVMQANFIPGGLILGNCLHHVAGDGICNFLWHQTLGSHFAAIADGLVRKPTLPVHFRERSGVVEGDQGATLEELPNWKFAEDTASFLNPTVYSPEEISGFEYATYFISTEKLALLKSLISFSIPEVKLSTTEILGAFLWRHVVVARNIDGQTYPETKLSITVDARGRMKSPMVPLNYWGNFAEPNAVARLPIDNLQKGSVASEHHFNDAYAKAAREIRREIDAVNDKAVRRLVGLLNQMPKSTTLTWNTNRYPGPDMLLVCIQGHRFNDIHFGHELGYPSAMRCTVGDTEGKPDGRCLILPPRRIDGKGLEVAMQYDSKTLERLDNDKEFMGFFVRRN